MSGAARRRSALLVMDLQAGVLPGCWDAEGVVRRTARLVERARAERVQVVWVQDEDDFPRGSTGWQLVHPFEAGPDEQRVGKVRRDAFVGTDLADVLVAAEVGRLIVAGAETDRCVRTTAERAASKGYDVTLVADCHTTRDLDADVFIPARSIVAHTNALFATLRYPDRRLVVARHDDPRLFAFDLGDPNPGTSSAIR